MPLPLLYLCVWIEMKYNGADNKKLKVEISGSDRAKVCRKRRQKQPPKKGLGDRQVGAFSVFCARHTGGPFIFGRKSSFFQKTDRFRGWCNITPDRPEIRTSDKPQEPPHVAYGLSTTPNTYFIISPHPFTISSTTNYALTRLLTYPRYCLFYTPLHCLMRYTTNILSTIHSFQLYI